MIELGMTAKDRVTGLCGVVTVISKHLTGCDRCWLEPPVDKDGKVPDGRWVDIDCLQRVGQDQIVIEQNSGKPGAREVAAPR